MNNIKKIVVYMLPVLLIVCALTVSASAQTRQRKPVRQTAKAAQATRSKTIYYISVGRTNAGQYSKRDWQKAADTFNRNGVSAFFAEHESLPLSKQTKGEWLLITIKRRLKAASVDALLLGPFSSTAAASAAVRKFPQFFSNEDNPLNEDYPGEWHFGNFLIMGVRTK